MSAANTPPPSNYSPPGPTNITPGSWATYEPPASEQPDYFIPYSRTTYQPTGEQLARDELRRRHLRRNVYLPVIAAAVIALALLALIVVLAFGVGTPEIASFIAGLSALTVILFSIPLIFIMAILPIAWLAFTMNRRQQRRNFPETGPMAYRSRVQILLWQLESLLGTVQHGTEAGSEKVRRPLVAVHAWAAYLRGMWRGIREKFPRSI
jgi:hypothetical protein